MALRFWLIPVSALSYEEGRVPTTAELREALDVLREDRAGVLTTPEGPARLYAWETSPAECTHATPAQVRKALKQNRT